jgi:hypothetical protein
LLKEGISAGELKGCLDWCIEILEQTWPATRSAVYVNGTVFSDNSAFHVNLGQPTWVAETHHSLRNWDADAEDALGLSDRNVKKILDEKDEAVRLAARLYEQVTQANPGLTRDAYDDLVWRFGFLRWYAEGFRLTTRLYIFSRLAWERRQPVEGPLREALEELKSYKDRLERSSYARSYPAAVLLNPERLDCYIKDVEAKIDSRKGEEAKA